MYEEINIMSKSTSNSFDFIVRKFSAPLHKIFIVILAHQFNSAASALCSQWPPK